MTEDQIVFKLVFLPEIIQVVGKCRHVVIKVCFVYFSVAANCEMDKTRMGVQVFHQRIVWVMHPGKNIDLMSQFAKFAGEFPDIDTHAAGIFGSQLPDGTTMCTEESYAQTIFSTLPGLNQLNNAAVKRNFLTAQSFFIDFITL